MITDIAEQHTQKKNDKFDVNNGNLLEFALICGQIHPMVISYMAKIVFQ